MKPMLNLASRTYLNRRAVYAVYLLLAGVLAVLLALNLGFIYRSSVQSTQILGHLAELDRAAANRRGAPADFSPQARERLRKRIAFANDLILKDNFRWIALLDRLEEVLPAGVRIREIQPQTRESSLRISGQARSVGDLQALLDSLLHSSDFSDSYLLQQARGEGKGIKKEDFVAFSIVVKGAF